MKRYAGVLLSVTSLPSKYGIGCFDQAAYDFVDWLVKAGQRYWQILPLGATSHGGSDDSPYQAYSAFAGNPYLISLEELIKDGVLSCCTWPTSAATSARIPNSRLSATTTIGGSTIMPCSWP